MYYRKLTEKAITIHKYVGMIPGRFTDLQNAINIRKDLPIHKNKIRRINMKNNWRILRFCWKSWSWQQLLLLLQRQSIFLVPSHTSVSSISGLGIVRTNFVPLPLFRHHHDSERSTDHRLFTCGREFGVKPSTPVSCFLFSWTLKNLPGFWFDDKQSELDVLCYTLVVSVGLSILLTEMLLPADLHMQDHE